MQAGNRLVIYCAGVTALLVILTFAATGYPLQGCVAAVGSGLSSAFLVRTSIGRIDTDLLNLGLLYIIFCGVIMAGKSTTTKHTLFWCVVAGLMGRLFLHWYDKSQLVWLALASLIWLLICRRIRPLVLGCSVFLFVIISGVDFFNPLDSGYLKKNFRNLSL